MFTVRTVDQGSGMIAGPFTVTTTDDGALTLCTGKQMVIDQHAFQRILRYAFEICPDCTPETHDGTQQRLPDLRPGHSRPR